VVVDEGGFRVYSVLVDWGLNFLSVKQIDEALAIKMNAGTITSSPGPISEILRAS